MKGWSLFVVAGYVAYAKLHANDGAATSEAALANGVDGKPTSDILVAPGGGTSVADGTDEEHSDPDWAAGYTTSSILNPPLNIREMVRHFSACIGGQTALASSSGEPLPPASRPGSANGGSLTLTNEPSGQERHKSDTKADSAAASPPSSPSATTTDDGVSDGKTQIIITPNVRPRGSFSRSFIEMRDQLEKKLIASSSFGAAVAGKTSKLEVTLKKPRQPPLPSVSEVERSDPEKELPAVLPDQSPPPAGDLHHQNACSAAPTGARADRLSETTPVAPGKPPIGQSSDANVIFIVGSSESSSGSSNGYQTDAFTREATGPSLNDGLQGDSFTSAQCANFYSPYGLSSQHYSYLTYEQTGLIQDDEDAGSCAESFAATVTQQPNDMAEMVFCKEYGVKEPSYPFRLVSPERKIRHFLNDCAGSRRRAPPASKQAAPSNVPPPSRGYESTSRASLWMPLKMVAAAAFATLCILLVVVNMY